VSAPDSDPGTRFPDGRLRCAPAAQERGDPSMATAAPAVRMLLIEQPGAWGRDALLQSRLDRPTAQQLASRARAQGMRVLLIRRVGRTAAGSGRSWAVADTRPGHEGVTWGTFTRDRELLDIDVDSPGPSSREPVYLVCAHGSHDTCCAVRGRAVAAVLSAVRPGSTWECSHVGGCRFAANLVVLPHGLYYGPLSPLRAVEVAAAYEVGQVDLENLRGRAALSAPVQAAQGYARTALREHGVDALPPRRVEQLDPATWRVGLARAGATVEVTVRLEQSAPPAQLTCAATILAAPRTYRLVELAGR